MKKLFLPLILTITTACSIVYPSKSEDNSPEKPITINDTRKYGLDYYDTTVVGYQLNEVKVDKGLSLKSEYEYGSKDTINLYTMHFYKMFEGRLRNYFSSYHSNEEFDIATYKWITDTLVSVTLINSITKNKKTFRLFQTFSKGSSGGIMIDDYDNE